MVVEVMARVSPNNTVGVIVVVVLIHFRSNDSNEFLSRRLQRRRRRKDVFVDNDGNDGLF